MVVIECPHCSEDVEMDDDAFGLFDCPHCGNEYEWGEAPKKKRRPRTTQKKTRTTQKKTRTTEMKKRFNRQDGKKILEYGGIQVSALFATFVMLMLLFTGLNSDEWYTADWWEEYEDEDRTGCDLSDGTGSGDTWNFGTSSLTRISERDTRSGSCWNDDMKGDEYTQITYNGEEYSNTLIQLELQIEVQEESCDNPPEWFDSEEKKEWEEECAEDLEDMEETYDWYNGWDNAGSIINIFMVFSFIFCLLILSIKSFLLLQNIGVVKLDDNLTSKISFSDNLLSSIMAGIIVFGLVLYWLLVPDFNHLFRLNENWEEPDDYSYGLGMIWWFLMIYSFIYIAISVLGMGKKASSN